MLNRNVAGHCHVNCGSDTHFEGKLQRVLIVEVKLGLDQPLFFHRAREQARRDDQLTKVHIENQPDLHK